MEDYSQDTIQQREIHSVTEINQTASDFLNEAFPPVWVAGEISNFRVDLINLESNSIFR